MNNVFSSRMRCFVAACVQLLVASTGLAADIVELKPQCDLVEPGRTLCRATISATEKSVLHDHLWRMSIQLDIGGPVSLYNPFFSGMSEQPAMVAIFDDK